MALKGNRCYYLVELRFKGNAIYSCKLKGVFINLDDCTTCKNFVVRTRRGGWILGQRRLTEYYKRG